MCVCSLVICSFVFFQAEDGIRDLVRSRGLGDVYKRQVHYDACSIKDELRAAVILFQQDYSWLIFIMKVNQVLDIGTLEPEAVSYTHLTLPTSDLV